MTFRTMGKGEDETWTSAGVPIDKAKKAVILLHGRGSSGGDMIRLSDSLPRKDVSYVAPSAKWGSWYPNRFLVPTEENEPDLSAALGAIGEVVSRLKEAGVPSGSIGFVGFSQGACLALEYVSRSDERFGFVAALSGALIGPLGTDHGDKDLRDLPTLIACAECDAHIPLDHVTSSADTFRKRGANVTEIVFPGSGHTIYAEEIEWLSNQLRKF